MPNSQEFQRFLIPNLGGGLQRAIRRSLQPPGTWFKAEAFRPLEGAAQKIDGFRPFSEEILSPEFQLELILGSASNVTVVVDGGMPSGFRTTFDVAGFWELLGTIGTTLTGALGHNGQVLARIEEQPLYEALPVVTFVPLIGGPPWTQLICDGIYAGPPPGSVDWPTGTRKRMVQTFAAPDVQPVQQLFSFFTSAGNEILYAATARDWYRWIPSGLGGSFSLLTPEITGPGTVNLQNGNPVVTGTGTTFQTSGARAGDLFHRGILAVLIQSVDSETQITLDTGWPGGNFPTSSYTIRNIYQRQVANKEARKRYWNVRNWLSGTPGKMIVATNGFDEVLKHDGATATMQALGGLAAISVEAARVVVPFADRLLLGYTKEAGTFYERRWRWSDLLDAETWQALKFKDLQSEDEIVAGELLSGFLVSLNSRSIHNIRQTDAPFDFNFGGGARIPDLGCVAAGSVQAIRNQAIVFLGPDDFYEYDLTRARAFGQPVRKLVFDGFNDEMAGMIRSARFDEQRLYLVSIPQKDGGSLYNWKTLAYDWSEQRWHEPYEGFMAFTTFFQKAEGVIDDDDRIIDTVTELIDSRSGVGRPIPLAGGRSGQVMRIFDGADEDSAELVGVLELGSFDFGSDAIKNLGWVVLEAEGSGDVIEWFTGVSLNGEDILWDASPYTLTLKELDPSREADLLIPVDKVGKFFTFRIRAPFRNQLIRLHRIDCYWRPMGMS